MTLVEAVGRKSQEVMSVQTTKKPNRNRTPNLGQTIRHAKAHGAKAVSFSGVTIYLELPSLPAMPVLPASGKTEGVKEIR